MIAPEKKYKQTEIIKTDYSNIIIKRIVYRSPDYEEIYFDKFLDIIFP
jgi:hypothetical protein